MERIVAVCGISVALMIAAVFFFLATESRYAFDREVGYGMRFAAQPPAGAQPDEEVGMDANATLLAAHQDGADDIDDKESIPMPALMDLQGMASLATGTVVPAVGQDPDKALEPLDPIRLTRDDWRGLKPVTQGARHLLFVYSTAEYDKKTFRLRWEPDAAFDPVHAAHRLILKLKKGPEGVSPISIDLSAKPTGSIDLPAWAASTDEDRTQRYIFEMVAEPKYSNSFTATMAGFFRTDWAPTLQYPRFGFIPLLLSTLTITILAILFATVPAVMTAIYLSELAPHRIREWLKPVVELLASVPTVVLGYFGLMLVAPAVMETLGKALHFESGRSLLTASIVMAVLIIPTIVSIAEDALRNVPLSLRDGAEALGMTRVEAIRYVIVKTAKPGLVSAALFGFARATGETMIVWILGGGTVSMPEANLQTLGQPTKGIPDTIGIEMANVVFEQPHYGHLFLIGVILFLITISVNLAGHRYAKKVAI